MDFSLADTNKDDIMINELEAVKYTAREHSMPTFAFVNMLPIAMCTVAISLDLP